jgi:peptidoglycan/LPS O-acetylase OafA/YrhL
VIKNWRHLTSTKRSEDDIKAIHGIRFLNAFLIFFCHKSVDSLLPRINRTELAINTAGPASIIIRMCALYTDVFLMLSGLLVAYSLAKKLKSGQKINAITEYIGRYIRIMPNMLATMLVTAYIIPHFVHQSPHRANVIEKPAKLCKLYGWRNLLLIHNWFSFEDMCNLHTHHVGSDFELFLTAPLLLTLLWKWPRRGSVLIILLAAVSTLGRFYVTYTGELMYFVPFGAKLSKLLDTANNLYSLPTYRFTVYGIGLLSGFTLRTYTINLSRLQYLVGQVINATLIVIVIAAGINMTGVNVKYNAMHHALYAAFAPILYCLHVAWIIFAAQQGHKSN